MEKNYETVIGLEVHVELSTKSKIFCGCSTAFGGRANSHTCPVCTGMPGALPVLNKRVVEYAVKVGLATNCEITRFSKFDRKNYFYPDNPQNYQISQLYSPICHNGYVEIETECGVKKVGIHEIHMEEDAGKLIHDEAYKVSYIDYNRSGVPLIEIVSEPDMRNAEEVIAYLEKLRMLIQYLGVSDCKLQEGSMRVDINLSVKEKSSEQLGTRTEMKNLNSFRSIKAAILEESKRQIEILQKGECVVMETRRWDDGKSCSYSMRSKENAQDYRYFPEPDIPPIWILEEWIQNLKSSLPEFREEKKVRYKKEYGLPDYDIDILTGSKHLSDFFEETTALCKEPKLVSNWLMGETLRLLNEKNMDLEEIHFSPENLAKLIELTQKKQITASVAKEVFKVVFEKNINPEKYVKENGLLLINNEERIRIKVQEVMETNPQSVEDYHNGKEKAIGFLIGQTMKAMKGKADPAVVSKIIKELLDEK